MELKSYLKQRRTVPALSLAPPAPEGKALEELLALASRTPDHGKLAPWRFIVFSGAARAAAGRLFLARARAKAALQNQSLDKAQEEKEQGLFTRAPLVVALISTAAEHPKIPLWEQELAAGAVGMNLLHAAAALGFAAQWLTGWPAYDEEVCRAFGLGQNERIAGFFHIGTPAERPAERARPDVAALMSHWEG